MANIIYGVSGEGSGHSSRAKVIAQHLINKGHNIKVVSYDRGFRNLSAQFDCIKITGLTIASSNNQVSKSKTIAANLAKIPAGHKSIKKLISLFQSFKPDVVITDFEPCSAYLANHYHIPLISIDNQHRMRYLEMEYPKSLIVDALITKAVISSMIPKPQFSLVTSFHDGEVKNDHTFVFPPMIRQEVEKLTPCSKEHTLVYLTSGCESLLEILPKLSGQKFFVYGYNKEEKQGNIEFKPFSNQGFLSDLASAKAVIATAGFTLISECLYLGKPYFALPMQGQFEQQLNAFMLSKKRLGESTEKPNLKALTEFYGQLPKYQHDLKSFPRNGNQAILDKLDNLLTFKNQSKVSSYD